MILESRYKALTEDRCQEKLEAGLIALKYTASGPPVNDDQTVDNSDARLRLQCVCV